MTARKRRRGFNLIEAAIVLGVVGLVIGGIWVAAAQIHRKMVAQETVTLMSKAIELYRKYFSTINNSYVHLGNLLSLEQIPPSFKYDTSGGWGQTIYGNGIFLYDFSYDTANKLWGSIFFGAYPSGDPAPVPTTCIEVTKFLLKQNFEYNQSDSINLDGGISWTSGSPVPTTTEIINACATTTHLYFNYILP